jgi:hypothetical protein
LSVGGVCHGTLTPCSFLHPSNRLFPPPLRSPKIEVRLLAHYSEDRNLLAAFTEEGPLAAASAGPTSAAGRQRAPRPPHLTSPPASSARPPPSQQARGVRGAAKREDFFRRLARQWRALAPAVPVSDTERAHAKELCYGIIYGAGVSERFDRFKFHSLGLDLTRLERCIVCIP